MIVADGFIPNFEDLERHAQGCDYRDEENPYDGVVYPLICRDIPQGVRDQIIIRLTELLGRPPSVSAMFLRRSPAGVHVPHIAHTDKSMGDYSLMLYLNDIDGGTAILRHKKTGMMYQPESPDYVQVAVEDMNSPESWAVVEQSAMKKNRAAIFDAGLFHCALPVGGSGAGSEARTVLTAFFS